MDLDTTDQHQMIVALDQNGDLVVLYLNDGFNKSWEEDKKLYNLEEAPTILEKLLKGTKKTHEKIVNKQIQEIQDSKNAEISGISFEDSKGKKYQFDIEEIEQNQKIVEALIVQYRFAEESLMSNGLSKTDKIQISYLKSTLAVMFKNVTGKDIKDLYNNFKSKSGGTMKGSFSYAEKELIQIPEHDGTIAICANTQYIWDKTAKLWRLLSTHSKTNKDLDNIIIEPRKESKPAQIDGKDTLLDFRDQ